VEEKIKSEDLFLQISEGFGEPKTPLGAMSPLTLAFLGDAVYSIVIRTIVVNKGNTANHKLHSRSTEYVSAPAQARLAENLMERGLLTDEEQDILRRGMNAKPKHQAKNASTKEYHLATGFEALCGYLYLGRQMGRLLDLLSQTLEI